MFTCYHTSTKSISQVFGEYQTFNSANLKRESLAEICSILNTEKISEFAESTRFATFLSSVAHGNVCPVW